MSPRPARGPRRIARTAGIVALFGVSGATAGALAFMSVFAIAGLVPTLGVPEIRSVRDVIEACALGGGILLLPVLAAAAAMVIRKHGDPSASRWLADSGLLAAIASASVCPLVLGGLALAGIGVDSGLAQRMVFGSAVLAFSGWIGGVGGALATLNLRQGKARPLPGVFD